VITAGLYLLKVLFILIVSSPTNFVNGYSMGSDGPISPQKEDYYPPERWSEFRVQIWKSKVCISQYQGLRHLQMTSDFQGPLISFAPLSSQFPVFGVYCNATIVCETQSQNGQDCTLLTYYNTKKFTMTRGMQQLL
jgi:hypothetical protein